MAGGGRIDAPPSEEWTTRAAAMERALVGLLVAACGGDTIMIGDTFAVHGLVAAHVDAANSAYCDVSWQTQVNDNGRSYTYNVTFSPSGVPPSTYLATTTGTAAVSLTFPGLAGGVAWVLAWDTLHASGSATISSCAVH